ncbi:MAG: NAD-dependent deacetylase [Candidatus Omnitrophota bacterium]
MDALTRLKYLIKTSKKLVVFTGAGISTESGISDYRSKGGFWGRHAPVTYQEFLSDDQKRVEYWNYKMELYESLVKAVPNPGHYSIVKMEQSGKLTAVITQNIDGLHQLAGSHPNRVIELHGTNREVSCLSCRKLFPWQEVYQRLKDGESAPICLDCSGFLKPNTISFGQRIDPWTLDQAVQFSGDCDLFIAVGSTLVVEPAASLPRMAKRAGAALVIITLSETPLDGIADLKIEASASETLSAAVQELSIVKL